MKKKLIAVFLIVATLLTCVFAFAACDKDKDKGNDNGNNNVSDDIKSYIDKIATYILTKDNDLTASIMVREFENENANDMLYKLKADIRFNRNHIMLYETEEFASAAINKIKAEEYYNYHEQKGRMIFVGEKKEFEELFSIENQFASLVTKTYSDKVFEFIDDMLNGNNTFYMLSLYMQGFDSNQDMSRKVTNKTIFMAEYEIDEPSTSKKDAPGVLTGIYEMEMFNLIDNASENDKQCYKQFWEKRKEGSNEKIIKINDQIYYIEWKNED